MSLSKNAQPIGCYHLDSQFNNAIQDIYHYSHNNTHSKFKHLVLNTLRKLINCDSAHWATFIDANEKNMSSYYSSSSELTASTSVDSSNELANETNTPDMDLLLSSLSNLKLGETFISQKQSNYYTNKNNNQNNVANIQAPNKQNFHLLVTIEKSKQSQLHDIFVLQRNEKQEKFGEDERILNQHLIPHILEAYRINLLHNRLINDFSTRTAICDMKGNLLLADKNFTSALSDLHSESEGQKIPTNVFKSLLENESLTYNKRKIIMKAQIIDDLMFVNFLEDRRCGGLSSNERLVTKYMIQGLNHIDMAKQLKLPVSSILYTVNCIFKKLGIKNKAELNMLFSGTQQNLEMAFEP